MPARHAAVLLSLLLSACASCLASPVGVLVGPFAGQVLAQQRQEAAQDKAAERKPDQAVNAMCQPEREGKGGVTPGNASKARCEMPLDNAIAVRTRGDLDPLPEPDKKSTAN
jgi:hypothetical protein